MKRFVFFLLVCSILMLGMSGCATATETGHQTSMPITMISTVQETIRVVKVSDLVNLYGLSFRLEYISNDNNGTAMIEVGGIQYQLINDTTSHWKSFWYSLDGETQLDFPLHGDNPKPIGGVAYIATDPGGRGMCFIPDGFDQPNLNIVPEDFGSGPHTVVKSYLCGELVVTDVESGHSWYTFNEGILFLPEGDGVIGSMPEQPYTGWLHREGDNLIISGKARNARHDKTAIELAGDALEIGKGPVYACGILRDNSKIGHEFLREICGYPSPKSFIVEALEVGQWIIYTSNDPGGYTIERLPDNGYKGFFFNLHDREADGSVIVGVTKLEDGQAIGGTIRAEYGGILHVCKKSDFDNKFGCKYEDAWYVEDRE